MGKSFNKNPMVTNTAVSPAIRDPRTVLARDQVQDANNPYIPEFHYPDDTVCTECGAVYYNQHWNIDEPRRRMLENAGAPNEVICPACRITNAQDPQGIVTLSGDYWQAHREDILNLIRNEEQRGQHVNVLERIMNIREEDGKLIVETTNEKLAQRIGRRMHSAHKGTVDYKFSGNNHLARIYWERTLE